MLEKRPEKRYEQASQIIKELNILGRLNIEAETSETLLSYIPEKGRFIGRKNELDAIRNTVCNIKDSKANHSTIVVSGKKGVGKKRFLDEIKYYAQMSEFPTSTADGHNSEEVEKWLDDIEKHLTNHEGAKIFLLHSSEWLESATTLIEKIKNSLTKLPLYAKSSPTIIAMAIDSDSFLKEEFFSLADLKIDLSNFTQKELREYLTSQGMEDEYVKLRKMPACGYMYHGHNNLIIYDFLGWAFAVIGVLLICDGKFRK